jgi:hypothetical protein
MKVNSPRHPSRATLIEKRQRTTLRNLAATTHHLPEKSTVASRRVKPEGVSNSIARYKDSTSNIIIK